MHTQLDFSKVKVGTPDPPQPRPCSEAGVTIPRLQAGGRLLEVTSHPHREA